MQVLYCECVQIVSISQVKRNQTVQTFRNKFFVCDVIMVFFCNRQTREEGNEKELFAAEDEQKREEKHREENRKKRAYLGG